MLAPRTQGNGSQCWICSSRWPDDARQPVRERDWVSHRTIEAYQTRLWRVWSKISPLWPPPSYAGRSIITVARQRRVPIPGKETNCDKIAEGRLAVAQPLALRWRLGNKVSTRRARVKTRRRKTNKQEAVVIILLPVKQTLPPRSGGRYKCNGRHNISFVAAARPVFFGRSGMFHFKLDHDLKDESLNFLGRATISIGERLITLHFISAASITPPGENLSSNVIACRSARS